MALIFTLTSILSAFLVFLIQPVVAKIALPTLGGTPVVWNGCMLFFQAALLAGYGYAHIISTRVPASKQPRVHLILIAVALLCLPVAFDRIDAINPSISPMLWLLATLATSVGLPFLVITATSPLLQKWFSYTDHPDAQQPYFLYAASNIGSMGALLVYPIGIEPFLPLMGQVGLWETGIMALAVLFVALAWLLRHHGSAATVAASAAVNGANAGAAAGADETIDGYRRFSWIILAFVPSSLLYGVTTYITTDIASAPMLWIVPLILYLLTFILVFEKNLLGYATCRKLHMPFVLILIFLMSMPSMSPTATVFILHITVFFITAMTMHGQLSTIKPSPKHLTEFFFWMSLGGVLGGFFNTLVAPFVFNSIIEYPLALVLSLALRTTPENIASEVRSGATPLVIVAISTIAFGYASWAWLGGVGGGGVRGVLSEQAMNLRTVYIGAIAASSFLIYVLYNQRPALLGLGLGLVLIGSSVVFTEMMAGQKLMQERSIFGVNRVTVAAGGVNLFMHGTTIHGAQYLDEARRLEPTTYFANLQGIFDAVNPALAKFPIALAGIGAGTITCYGTKDDTFDLYDIDPLVVEIAQNPNYFTYLRDCLPQKNIIIGDARMKISEQPDEKYKLMIFDAFSSDAIPLHLITKEAINIYKKKIKAGGLMVFHISNRHIELRPVLAAVAEATQMVGYFQFFKSSSSEWSMSSLWVVLAASDQDMSPLLRKDTNWEALPKGDRKYLWMDDFSNILFNIKIFNKFEFGAASRQEQK